MVNIWGGSDMMPNFTQPWGSSFGSPSPDPDPLVEAPHGPQATDAENTAYGQANPGWEHAQWPSNPGSEQKDVPQFGQYNQPINSGLGTPAPDSTPLVPSENTPIMMDGFGSGPGGSLTPAERTANGLPPLDDTYSQYNQPINGGIPMPGGGSLKDQYGLGALAGGTQSWQAPDITPLGAPGTPLGGPNVTEQNYSFAQPPAINSNSTPTSQATTMSSSGTPAGTTVQNVTTNTSNLPAYAQPYFTDLMQRGQALSNQTYTPYPDQRVAGFSDLQNQAQNEAGNLNTPSQFGTATGIAQQAGLGALQAGQNFNPGQFSAQNVSGPRLNNYQMNGPQNVTAGNYNAPSMDAAQTGFQPNLQNYQMQGPQNVNAPGGLAANAAQMEAARSRFDPNSFNEDGTAQKYMSPYIQNVIDRQKQQAYRDAQKSQLTGDLGAARQGTYGGARQLLASTERERNLGDTQANITASGLQSAYQNAQQQFNSEQGMKQQTSLANLSAEQQANVQNQAARLQMQGMDAQQALQAALANQQAGLTTGQANLSANLATQQLGTQSGLQAALANLSSQQQANVQNQAAKLQTQGLNADQAMKAALANQQMGFNVGQQNLNASMATQQLGANLGMDAQKANQMYDMEAQKAAEQSKQFGSSLGLQGLSQANTAATTLANLGTTEQNAKLQNIQAKTAAGAQQQALRQQYLDTNYADFLRQRDYPQELLNNYSALLHGVPVTPSSTQTTYAPPPSLLSQISGAGIGALSLSKLMG